MIVSQPADQMIPVGSDTTLEVKAANDDSFQWLRDGVAIPGQTKSSLIISKVETKDAGNYSCIVSKGLESVASRVASLLVYIKAQAANATTTPNGGVAQPMSGGFSVTVFGSPVFSGGSSGSCPGPYAGYVTFAKTPGQGWGWSPSNGTKLYMVADGGGRSDTIVQYGGNFGDSGCDQTSVTIPSPAYSTKYRFAIYFPDNVPTTNYPITLIGFNP